MASTRISICNSALKKLGANIIQSFDDPSSEAEYCRELYDPTRYELLLGTRWSWMTDRSPMVMLSAEDTQEGPYKYVFSLMNPEFGAIRAVYDKADAIVPRVDGWTRQGLNLYAEFNKAWIEHPRTILEPQFPLLFTTALIDAMAFQLAYPITKDLPTQSAFRAMADQSLRLAQKDDGQSKPPEQVTRFSWVDARLGAGAGFGSGSL